MKNLSTRNIKNSIEKYSNTNPKFRNFMNNEGANTLAQFLNIQPSSQATTSFPNYSPRQLLSSAKQKCFPFYLQPRD